jgi:hypothetical protein
MLLVAVCSPLRAGMILFEHSGNADPTTEGWSVGGGGGPGQVVGPLTNDAGSGLDAWFVNDTSSALFSNIAYFQTPTAAQNSQASALGWSLKTTIRIPNASETDAGAPLVLYRDGSISWGMFFGSDADGDPTVFLHDGGGAHPNFTGPRFTLQGAGSTYHTYELVYDPSAGSADLFFDGVERLSGFVGYALAASSVSFGSGSSADTGQGNFNQVQFEVNTNAVPEPSSIALLGMGGLMLCGFSRRQRRRRRSPGDAVSPGTHCT